MVPFPESRNGERKESMVFFITGASRGLGLCLTEDALRRGHEVIAAQRKPQGDLEKLRQEFPDRLRIVELDVTSEEQAAQLASSLEGISIDVLINNAGVLLEPKFPQGDVITGMDLQMLRTTLECNAVGPAVVLKYFAPLVYRSKQPCILNISSEAGHLEPNGWNYIAYSMSKHAENMYTQKIRNYLAHTPGRENVRIFMVHPGRMNTKMGVENAQIEPQEAATGILDIAEGKIDPHLDIPFIDYRGSAMPG